MAFVAFSKLWWLKESIMNTKHVEENHSEKDG